MRSFAILLLLVVLQVLCGCSRNPPEKNLYYPEARLPFIDLAYYRIKGNSWIRKPENIVAVHETLKKIGYDKFVSAEDLATYQMWYYSPDKAWLNIPLGIKIDSLVLSYPAYNKASQFYKEFWERRLAEHNDQEVYFVLSEVRDILLRKKELKARDELVNDTLYRLANFEFNSALNERVALDYFSYLRALGLYQSAHNLLFESYRFQKLQLNRDSLDKTLARTDKPSRTDPWIVDDTK
jgi:hypothetical protein